MTANFGGAKLPQRKERAFEMGKLIVENATVERVFQTKNGSWGVRVAESFTRQDGEQGREFFTLWFTDQPNLMQGNVVTAEGRLGTKIWTPNIGEGEARQRVDVSMHDAVLLESGAGGAVAAPVVSSQQPWNLPPASNREPF